MTAHGHYHRVKVRVRRSGASGAVALVAVAAAVASSGSSAATTDASAGLPAGWSHAQINVVGARGRAHTQIYDRGRVQSVTSSSLTLKERDGSIVTIRVAPDAVVTVSGRRAPFARIVPRFWVRTLGIDGLPAKLVAAIPPPAAAKARTARPGATSQLVRPASVAQPVRPDSDAASPSVGSPGG
jgi:hypothetical protein